MNTPVAMMAIFLCGPPAVAGQAAAQAEAGTLYAKAADDSLRASVLDGMRAFTQLGKGNLSGAYKSGVAAFAGYDRGGKLDDARSTAALKAHALGDGKGAAPAAIKTSFSRLDPAFLKQGDAAGVVADFEKVTGIRSDRFLRRLGEASDNPVEWNDPRLGSKLLGRIEAASSELRDGAFKKVFQGALRMFPAAWIDRHPGEAKRKLEAAVAGKGSLGEFLALSGTKAPAGAHVAAAELKAGSEELEPVAPAATEEKTSADAEPAAERVPASPAMVGKAAPASQGGISVGFMKEILRAQDQADSSLFTRVRRRYQSVAVHFSL